jgi:hypothetical protein
MRLRGYSLTVTLVAAFILSFVNGRSIVHVRNVEGIQHDFEEHEESHWDESARLTFNSTSYAQIPAYSLSNLRRRQSSDPEWLRIMPLGASIVRGLRSSPEDGFRKALRDHLRSIDFKVNMVGSQ